MHGAGGRGGSVPGHLDASRHAAALVVGGHHDYRPSAVADHPSNDDVPVVPPIRVASVDDRQIMISRDDRRFLAELGEVAFLHAPSQL
jgi:hypothetical protein